MSGELNVAYEVNIHLTKHLTHLRSQKGQLEGFIQDLEFKKVSLAEVEEEIAVVERELAAQQAKIASLTKE